MMGPELRTQRSRNRAGRLIAIAIAIGWPTSVLAQDYLDQIEMEAGKVEQHTPAADGGGGSGGASSKDRLTFEAILQDEYAGSYTFYEKLPERSRQEIVDDYVNGASIDEIREKIVNRYLQR